MNDWNTLHNPLFQVDFATRTYMAYVLTLSPVAYLLTQPMSTPIYCRCLVLIFFHHRWIQSQTYFFKLHNRNYSVRFHNCTHWVADTPKNLHPNTLGNHFEIHFQWHINSSLVNKPRSIIFATQTLNFDYKQLLQVNFESSLGTMLVAQLAYVYNWSNCSIIYTVMDNIVIQKANQYRICIIPQTKKKKTR